MNGINDFAKDVEATVPYPDKDGSLSVVTVSSGMYSGFAHLLGVLSKVIRHFGINKS